MFYVVPSIGLFSDHLFGLYSNHLILDKSVFKWSNCVRFANCPDFKWCSINETFFNHFVRNTVAIRILN